MRLPDSGVMFSELTYMSVVATMSSYRRPLVLRRLRFLFGSVNAFGHDQFKHLQCKLCWRDKLNSRDFHDDLEIVIGRIDRGVLLRFVLLPPFIVRR